MFKGRRLSAIFYPWTYSGNKFRLFTLAEQKSKIKRALHHIKSALLITSSQTWAHLFTPIAPCKLARHSSFMPVSLPYPHQEGTISPPVIYDGVPHAPPLPRSPLWVYYARPSVAWLSRFPLCNRLSLAPSGSEGHLTIVAYCLVEH